MNDEIQVMNGNYDDIINLPHYEPKRHPRMSPSARAAQFAPFAALTGYDEAIKESERDINGMSEQEAGSTAIPRQPILDLTGKDIVD